MICLENYARVRLLDCLIDGRVLSILGTKQLAAAPDSPPEEVQWLSVLMTIADKCFQQAS
jgi:hypothetical protein